LAVPTSEELLTVYKLCKRILPWKGVFCEFAKMQIGNKTKIGGEFLQQNEVESKASRTLSNIVRKELQT